jgi:hypothetical protein
MSVDAQIPEHIDGENIQRFVKRPWRKTATTEMVGPIILSRPTTVETSEGGYDLPAGWEGFIAIDADDKPYPVEKAIHDRTYEPAWPENDRNA